LTQFFVIPTQGMAKGIYTLIVNTVERQEIDRVVVE
jgi:hypothetical protein